MLKENEKSKLLNKDQEKILANIYDYMESHGATTSNSIFNLLRDQDLQVQITTFFIAHGEDNKKIKSGLEDFLG